MTGLKLKSTKSTNQKAAEAASPAVGPDSRASSKKFWQQRRFQIGGGVLVLIIIFLLVGAHSGKKSQYNNQVQANQNQSQNQPAHQQNPNTDYAAQSVYSQIPDCSGNQLLSTMPLDSGTSYDLLPLGLVNGTGGHTFPSDHMYFNFPGVDKVMNVRAPGNVYITKLQRDIRIVNGVKGEDTSIIMMPCKQVAFYLNHTQLSDSLNQAIPPINVNNSYNNCSDSTQGANTYHSCNQLAATAVKVKTGDIIATVHVNINQAGWDFGAYDSRVTPLAFVNPNRLNIQGNDFYGLNPTKAVCPLNYFPSAVQQQAYASPSLADRPASSRCGEVMQDKANTIQGDWYDDSSGGYVGDWTKFLGVVHYNLNPKYVLLSVGGTLGSGGLLGYTPKATGNINPEPSNTVVGQLYCFEDDHTALTSTYNYTLNHKILLQLADAKTMKAEYQTGSCTGGDRFASPAIYHR